MSERETATLRFTVAGRTFGPDRVLLIAELGTSHGGDVGKARELVDAAISSGADCVKFQHVYADEIIHPRTGLVPLPTGDIALYARFRSLETSPGFLSAMKERVESRGAIFLCTPFGTRSARELRAMGVRAMKIASPELNHVRLLDEVASYGLPVVLSTGVSRLGDIEYALDRLGRNGALLHCVTSYPAPAEDYNLRLLRSYAELFGMPCGVSDHSEDPVLVPALAVASGACIVEKHFCLSRNDDGLDDPIALPPTGFAAMARAVREAERSGAERTIRRLSSAFGEDRVLAVLGDGGKRLAPSEAANYERTNRSLHAARAISAGERLSEGNVSVLRTEKVLRPGIHPRYLSIAIGRIAARDVPDGEGIEWADLGGT